MSDHPLALCLLADNTITCIGEDCPQYEQCWPKQDSLEAKALRFLEVNHPDE